MSPAPATPEVTDLLERVIGRSQIEQERERAPEPEPAPEPPEVIRRHTDVSFPGEVRVGEVYSLRVQIIPAEETLASGDVREVPRPHPHDATMALEVPRPSGPEVPPPPVRVTVYVAAENFEVEGPGHGRFLPGGAADRLGGPGPRGRRRPEDPTWLAYCCFADPMARIEHAATPPAASSPA